MHNNNLADHFKKKLIGETETLEISTRKKN
jgi:hypothetical protein